MKCYVHVVIIIVLIYRQHTTCMLSIYDEYDEYDTNPMLIYHLGPFQHRGPPDQGVWGWSALSSIEKHSVAVYPELSQDTSRLHTAVITHTR